MLWVAIVSGLAFAVLLFRHLTRLGRHNISLAFSGILVLVPGWFAWQHHVLESRLSEAVREISGRPDAKVDCQGFLREFRLDNNLGEVRFGRDGVPSATAGLRGSVCDRLSDWLGSDKSNPSTDEVIAVHVLTHEAIHLSGVSDERATECQAMQRDAEMAMQLGATAEQARALAERYAAEVYPRMPRGYRSSQCAPDDDFDLTPGDGIWP